MSNRFDQASDRISRTDASLPNPAGGITVLGWVRLAVDTGNFATICRLSNSAGDSTSITFSTDNDGNTLAFFTAVGSIVTTFALAVGQWCRFAFTQTGTAGQVYVGTDSGALQLFSGSVNGAANPNVITFGGRSPGDAIEYGDVALAYERCFASVLTQAQITAELASTAPILSTWADWPLTSHTDLTDHSGNGRHLTAGATPTTTEDDPPLTPAPSGAASRFLSFLVP